MASRRNTASRRQCRFPRDSEPSEGAALEYLRRSVNFFYQCAAVDQITEATTEGGDMHCELRLGNDANWIRPHMTLIEERVTGIRAAAGLSSIGKVNVTTMA